MSNIEQSRSIVAAFWKMNDGTKYQLQQRDWEEYDAACFQAYKSHPPASWRNKWIFERRESKLYICNQEVWDFAARPNPDALTFAFAIAFAHALTFGFAFTLGLAFARLIPLGSPDPPEETPAPIPDPFTALFPFQGDDSGFWYETPDFRIAGSTGSLHLHGLSEDKIHHILQIVRNGGQ